MFNFRKKKKHTKTTLTEESLAEIHEEEGVNTENFFFTKSSVAEEYRDNRVSIKEWSKRNGEYVTKGDKLCELAIENISYATLAVNADFNGVLKIFKNPSNNQPTPIFLNNDEKLFAIRQAVSEEKIKEFNDIRFKNIPIIKTDDFLGTKEIKWESVAGRRESSSTDFDIFDSLIVYSNNSFYSNKLIFTLNNIDNRDYIVFKFSQKDYKLVIGSRISFLFENNQILIFEILTKPHKHSNHHTLGSWVSVFETKVQITTEGLEALRTKNLLKWKVEIVKTDEKITGVIVNQDIQFSIKKFAREYYNLVISEIQDYRPVKFTPVSNKNSNIQSESCYVYLMSDTLNNYHKIGISNKPKYREKTLQSEKPSIELICSKKFPNRKIAASFEQALHKSYAEKRIRGEWFFLTDKEVQDITETLI